MKPLIKQTIVIMGPTASGKSDLAILIARQYNGEIISADSRQVYRGMDIGTGKVAQDPIRISEQENKNFFFSDGIRHHLIDIASPKDVYNVTHFVRDSLRAITDIQQRGKTPIICGGTGFWIQALIDNQVFPAVKPDMKLRAILNIKSAEELFTMLCEKDPARAKAIDRQNKVRLIRALEICQALGKVPRHQPSRINRQNFSIIALTPPQDILYARIEKRLTERLRNGMIAEIHRLHEKDGISWKRLESFGLEYRFGAKLLQQKISSEAMQEELLQAIKHYAKRQMTWLKRFEKMGADIHWIQDPKEALKIIEKNK